ncbi:F0F1 ATP synthase subunit B [Patescibacteria group bacterium]|nr:F0F1 ATP synthase subunit B [Patescibacteria group bacterium]
MSELFSNLGIDVKLLLAQTVNFLLVLWLLNRFVFKKVLKFLDERKEGIEKGVELTVRAEREIERIGEARKVAMGKARKLAEDLLMEGKSKGQVAQKEIVAEARATAEVLLKKAKEESERKKQDALKEAEVEMQKRAFFLAEKVLLRSLTKEDQERMGQELLKEVQEHGKES